MLTYFFLVIIDIENPIMYVSLENLLLGLPIINAHPATTLINAHPAPTLCDYTPGAGEPADIRAEVQEGIDDHGQGHDVLDAGPITRCLLHKRGNEVAEPLAVAGVNGLQSSRGLHDPDHQRWEALEMEGM